MSPRPKSKPNGKDHDASPARGKQKPRSHRVRHPKEAEATPAENPGTSEPENPVARAAAVLEEERQEQAADTIERLSPGVTDDERDRLRQASRAVEVAELELARATKKRKDAQDALATAHAHLKKVSDEIASGTSQPGLPFDAAAHQADRDAMLQADREANTPALIERLRRARYLVTREQLDALDHAQRHELAEYVKKCEAAILDGSILNGVAVPALLASMHVANDPAPGEKRQTCTLCGMMLQAQPADFWDPGLRVGSDCPGVDVADERTETTHTDDAALEEPVH